MDDENGEEKVEFGGRKTDFACFGVIMSGGSLDSSFKWLGIHKTLTQGGDMTGLAPTCVGRMFLCVFSVTIGRQGPPP